MVASVLVLLCILGFAHAAAVQSGNGKQKQEEELAGPAEEIPQDLKIRLERVNSVWGSPRYSLTIRADGALTYEGKEYVAISGTVQGRITQQEIRKLIAEFESVEYFSLCDFYQSDAYHRPGDCCFPPLPALPPGNDSRRIVRITPTDYQHVRTSIVMNGRKKTIEHYQGCPQGKVLIGLEDKIDEIVGSKRWTSRGSH